jgi:Reverse transcriptase (RNA-dependent DNA polymerase)
LGCYDKELLTLESKMSLDVVDQQPFMNILPSTWAFCCKRYPNGTVRKLNARFCVCGDRQNEGIDYFDTFAWVVSLQTVQLMLIISIVLNLSTKQVDCTAAFVHAPINKPPNFKDLTNKQKAKTGVFVSMPRGFTKHNLVLWLNKSLYGLMQSPRNFFLHLKARLEKIGFVTQTDLNPCLLISNQVICLVYVDDTLFFSPKEEYIDVVIQQLCDLDMDLKVEGEVSGFLGVHIARSPCKAKVTLSQSGSKTDFRVCGCCSSTNQTHTG